MAKGSQRQQLSRWAALLVGLALGLLSLWSERSAAPRAVASGAPQLEERMSRIRAAAVLPRGVALPLVRSTLLARLPRAFTVSDSALPSAAWHALTPSHSSASAALWLQRVRRKTPRMNTEEPPSA
ncbi:MAG: hypothetical protein QM756_34895 [Polyangiaceae bacterium]